MTDPQPILATIAGVAATFIGFIGIIFAIGRYSSGGWVRAERNALLHLMLPSTFALFLALLPLVIATGFILQPSCWRILNALLAAIHLPMVANAARLAWHRQLLEPIPLRYILIPGGFLAVFTNVLVALGPWSEIAVFAYVVGLVWFLLVSAVQLLMLIVSQAQAD